jgi:hypothetical protein
MAERFARNVVIQTTPYHVTLRSRALRRSFSSSVKKKALAAFPVPRAGPFVLARNKDLFRATRRTVPPLVMLAAVSQPLRNNPLPANGITSRAIRHGGTEKIK